MRDLDVVCFGEALVDFLPDRRGRLRDTERFEVHSGGAPANVAVGLARQGLKVAFAGVVGEDEFGHLLARKLSAEGIETRLRYTSRCKTGMWFVALDETGNRSFFNPSGAASADKLVEPGDLPEALLERARWLHCGSSAHVHEAGQEALLSAARNARQRGLLVSFDPNLRPALWDDPRELERLVRAAFPYCDVVKLADEETLTCTGESDPERAAAWLVDHGVGLACITLGPKGALLRLGNTVLRVPAPVVEVADTTGAGDGFVAGLLTRLRDVGSLKELDLERLHAAATFGCAVGARVCTRLGAVAGLPRLGEAVP